MKRLQEFFQKLAKRTLDDRSKAASNKLSEELFYDLYADRKRIYKINFFRGIFFGAGSALGGTIVIALIVWILSLFVSLPFIGDVFQDAQRSIETRTDATFE